MSSESQVRTHSRRLVLPLTAISELSDVLQQFEAAVGNLRQVQDGQAEAGTKKDK